MRPIVYVLYKILYLLCPVRKHFFHSLIDYQQIFESISYTFISIKYTFILEYQVSTNLSSIYIFMNKFT